MSGYKRSDIKYDQRGEILLKIRSTDYRILEQLNFLRTRLNEFFRRKEEAQKLLDNLNLNEINEREKVLISIFHDLERKQGNLEKIYKNINRLNIQELQKISEDGWIVFTELKNLRDEIEKLEAQLEAVITINKLLAELKDIELRIKTALEQNASLIKDWREVEHQKLLQEQDKLNNEIRSIEKTNDIQLIKETLTKSRTYLAKLNGIITNCKEKDETARAQLEQIGVQIQELQKKLMLVKTDIVVKKIKEFLSLLESEMKNIINRKLRDISGLLVETQKAIPLLLEIDKHMFKVEKIISNINKKWLENGEKIQKWYSERSAQLRTKIDGFINNFENFKLVILTKNIFDIEKSKELFDALKVLMNELDTLIEDVNCKEEFHQKRLYVIKALREVCASLGFRELDSPHYAEENNFHSPIVQTFDTLNVGVIKFIITLDGKLESDSGISKDRCGLEFTDISKLLKDEFGVETEFRIVEEGEPLRKQKSAKDLPDASNKKFKER